MTRKVVLMGVVVAVFGTGIYLAAMELFKRSAVVEVGQPALDFTLQTLTGETFRLQDTLGRPVILNFFASWCEPCQQEQPILQRFEEDYGDSVELVLVDRAEPPVLVRQFVEQYQVSATVVMDSENRVSKMYQVAGQPETLFIDEQGILRSHYRGELVDGMLEEMLRQFSTTTSLAAGPASSFLSGRVHEWPGRIWPWL